MSRNERRNSYGDDYWDRLANGSVLSPSVEKLGKYFGVTQNVEPAKSGDIVEKPEPAQTEDFEPTDNE